MIDWTCLLVLITMWLIICLVYGCCQSTPLVYGSLLVFYVIFFCNLSNSGHAFEARIYAENVPRGFLPAAGTLHHYNPPPVSSTGNLQHYNVDQPQRDLKLYIWKRQWGCVLVVLFCFMFRLECLKILEVNLNGRSITYRLQNISDDLFSWCS